MHCLHCVDFGEEQKSEYLEKDYRSGKDELRKLYIHEKYLTRPIAYIFPLCEAQRAKRLRHVDFPIEKPFFRS